MDEIERIASELEQLSLDLNDVAMSLLAEAIRDKTGERPLTEKSVSQARRAVEKALHHLRGINTD
ncbi:unannotated protein [freshwater metagenome]|uniref:Unannotated protein n=1 Tax=freshwater metagenome TaxID=449393 RepID=A0A6J6FZN5_9ZZZZ|nr:hypothetical protein [Actinomycetota bacterium]MSZ96039.1 hypothetical protein [Actinomycetota bacterium]